VYGGDGVGDEFLAIRIFDRWRIGAGIFLSHLGYRFRHLPSSIVTSKNGLENTFFLWTHRYPPLEYTVAYTCLMYFWGVQRVENVVKRMGDERRKGYLLLINL